MANVFHAGDGNLHPLILFDAGKDGELARAERFGADILEACVAAGGTVTASRSSGRCVRSSVPPSSQPSTH